MNEDLKNLINHININFIKFSELWGKNNPNNRINLKKKFVKDIIPGSNILETIYGYRSFLSEKILELNSLFKEYIVCDSIILTRLKTLNSINDKIGKYTNKKSEQGNIPINKCLNDIFGVRIILKMDINFDQIKNFTQNYVGNIKCIDSSKGIYKATHIYFRKTNYDFPWELQIWRKEDENNNINSHKIYKQEYIEWVEERRK